MSCSPWRRRYRFESPHAWNSLEQRVLDHLAATDGPITATALRKLCQVRNTALHHVLAVLVEAGRARKDRAGYTLSR